MRKRVDRLIRVVSIALFMLCAIAPSRAQKINIGYIYPAGAQRGSTTTIAIGGQSIATAKSVLVSGDGVTAEILPAEPLPAGAKPKKKKKSPISDEDNLQLAQNIKVRITVAEDAELGIRDLRVIGGNGSGSNRLYFEVGEYSDIVESEPNNIPQEATVIERLPVTINGYVERCAVRGDWESAGGGLSAERSGKDYYKFKASAGETIVAEVKARRFVPYLADAVPGWFQPVVTIFDEAGREVAFCDDYQLRVDPVVIYNVERSGEYTLKIHDAIYRGREDFVYRINLGVIPYVSSVFPLGGELGSGVELEYRGVNLGGKRRKGDSFELVKRRVELDQSGRIALTYLDKRCVSSNQIPFQVQDEYPEIIAKEVGDEQVLISVNQYINGKIEAPYDSDWYRVNIPAVGTWQFEIIARKLQSPLDAKLTLYDMSGVKLAEQDDMKGLTEPVDGLLTHQADPTLSYKIATKGEYLLRVTDTQNKGGDEFGYRLKIEEARPSFTLSIEPASLSVPQGGTSLMTIFVQRYNDFRGNIDLDFKGLPAGFEVNTTSITRGAKLAKIAITAPADYDVGKLDLEIYGQGVPVKTMANKKVMPKAKGGNVAKVQQRIMPPQIDTKPQEATPVEQMLQAFYITHLLKTEELRVDVTLADPFTLSLEPVEGDQIRFQPNGECQVRVVVNRREGYNEPIQIMKKLTPAGSGFSSITIDGDKSEGIITVKTYYWQKFMPVSDFMVLGTVKGSTNNRVAGQARNAIQAAVMVNSRPAKVVMPVDSTPAMSLRDAVKKLK